MQDIVKEYDTKLDAKSRITVRSRLFEYYHVTEYSDGRILMEPRELTVPFQISANTLAMMDASVRNLQEGVVSDTLDLSEFGE